MSFIKSTLDHTVLRQAIYLQQAGGGQQGGGGGGGQGAGAAAPGTP